MQFVNKTVTLLMLCDICLLTCKWMGIFLTGVGCGDAIFSMLFSVRSVLNLKPCTSWSNYSWSFRLEFVSVEFSVRLFIPHLSYSCTVCKIWKAEIINDKNEFETNRKTDCQCCLCEKWIVSLCNCAGKHFNGIINNIVHKRNVAHF